MAEITVIEDSYEIARLVQLALGAKGHKVTTYHDGLDGLEGVLAKPPVLLISDVNLPGMNGFEVAKHVREKHGQRLGILMLTSRTDLDSRIEGLSHADDYLGKPFELRELTARVEALVRRYAAAAAAPPPVTPPSSAGNLRASLETVGGAIAALQMVSVTQNAGGIVIEGQGTIYLADGKVVHAQMEQEFGNAAAMKLLSLDKGAFYFDVNLKSEVRTMNADPMMLMLDVSRYMDESSKTTAIDEKPANETLILETPAKPIENASIPNAGVSNTNVSSLEVTQPSSKPNSSKPAPPTPNKLDKLNFDLGLNDSFEFLARPSDIDDDAIITDDIADDATDNDITKNETYDDDSFELAPEDILEPIDLNMEEVILMPSIKSALSLLEDKGLTVTERQDIDSGDICLLFENQGIRLAVLHCSLIDYNNR